MTSMRDPIPDIASENLPMTIKVVLWNALFVLIFIALMFGFGLLAVEVKEDLPAPATATDGSGHA
ncbi:hypothetical protein [Aurantimonas sp. VKM B-3413]|uniref:hypothetical protein n=1 Tax=Aurantimonas sp. VKM B-3413 TaxID=2779401 RepID=UPI001E3AD9F2|nr:hypothetical protein [Aurantimonas sp. VKM B-3413]MCB8835826.1 hypothetical protein [Aurantimonas sp. VKM B-3413]